MIRVMAGATTGHSLEFLDEFIAHYNGGGRLEVNKSPEKVEVLAELIKNGQRNSHHWQQAWSLYCQRYGRGVNDPYKHESSFLFFGMDNEYPPDTGLGFWICWRITPAWLCTLQWRQAMPGPGQKRGPTRTSPMIP